MTYNIENFLIFIGIVFVLFGQSNSARFLWNTGDYRFGDNFFKSDSTDTIILGNRDVLVINTEDTSIVIPRKNVLTFIDSDVVKKSLNPNYMLAISKEFSIRQQGDK